MIHAGAKTFGLFFSAPTNSGIEDKMNFPFEWSVSVPMELAGNVQQYYVWLEDNVGPVPRWDIDDTNFSIDDIGVHVKFLFKDAEDLIGFKLRFFGG